MPQLKKRPGHDWKVLSENSPPQNPTNQRDRVPMIPRYSGIAGATIYVGTESFLLLHLE